VVVAVVAAAMATVATRRLSLPLIIRSEWSNVARHRADAFGKRAAKLASPVDNGNDLSSLPSS